MQDFLRQTLAGTDSSPNPPSPPERPPCPAHWLRTPVFPRLLPAGQQAAGGPGPNPNPAICQPRGPSLSFPIHPSKSDSFMKVLGPAGGSRHSQPLAGLQYGKPSNEKKTEMAETSRPAEVTQASGLGHEWALSWGGRRTRAWGGDHHVRPKEWQCPGQARGRAETDSGLQPRPRGLGASGPSLPHFPVLGAPLTPSPATGKEPAVPRPNATVVVFLP